jgi:hypothetical protein
MRTALRFGGGTRTIGTLSPKLLLTAAYVLVLLGCAGSKTQLAQLLKTNVPCRVRLEPAWIGYAEPTIRTGTFTNSLLPQLEGLERELRFDWFTYSDKRSAVNFGPRNISKSEGGEMISLIHTFRSSLPTDADLTKVTTISELERLLGPSQGGRCVYGIDFQMFSSARWQFFSIKDAGTIETLSISCGVTRRDPDPEWRVSSMMGQSRHCKTQAVIMCA